MITTNKDEIDRELDKQDEIDGLFAILGRSKAAYPQAKTISASVTVKVGEHVEVSYSVTVIRGDV